MGRRYTPEIFAKSTTDTCIDSYAFIGIDVIAGFPGETEEDFSLTYDLLQGLKPLHVLFGEAGNKAAEIPVAERVPDKDNRPGTTAGGASIRYTTIFSKECRKKRRGFV